MKTNLHDSYESNAELEKEGKWVVIAEGVEFKIKRFGGANSFLIKKLQAKYVKPYARQIQKKIMAEEKEREIYIKVFTESCMCDWKGVLDAEHKEIPFSHKDAIDFFMQLPDLFDEVVVLATDFEAFREDLGNS